MRALPRSNLIIRCALTRPPISQTAIGVAQVTPNYHRASTYQTKHVTFKREQIAKMSTESTQSQACCNTPAVVSKGYSPKGDYIEVDGLKTCMLDVCTVFDDV
jgi:hypothetical protein